MNMDFIKDALTNQGVHRDVIAMRDHYIYEFPAKWQPTIRRLAERAENNIKAANVALKELNHNDLR